MNIGVILARAGSKRIPGKNTKLFGGVPLVQWAMIEAKRAENIDRVIVYTDDRDIATIAFDEHVTCIRRPSELSQDGTTSYETLIGLIDAARLHGDMIVLLQPTSPLRIAEDIEKTVKLAMTMINRIAVSVEIGKKDANGAVYVANASWILAGGNWDTDKPIRYDMPASRSHDIDTLEDFDRAEKAIA